MNIITDFLKKVLNLLFPTKIEVIEVPAKEVIAIIPLETTPIYESEPVVDKPAPIKKAAVKKAPVKKAAPIKAPVKKNTNNKKTK
jgi:hypothetical protein